MTTISGIKIKSNKKMNHWHSIIEEWILAHERYARLVQGDAAYWYTERTNIGIVAGAAWRCGMVALEEFQTTKDNSLTAKKEDQKTWKGRCDLWLSREGKEEIIEAKCKAMSLRSKDFSKNVSALLDEAVKDAKNTRWGEDILATGLLFIPVYSNVRLAEDAEDAEDAGKFVGQIDDIIKDLSALDSTLIAWCFPEKTRELMGPEKKNYWPGVIILGNSVE